MIDPVIVEAEGRATAEEGCLSIPEIYGDVTRPERVVLEALDRERAAATARRPPGSRPAPSSTRSTTSTASSSSITWA